MNYLSICNIMIFWLMLLINTFFISAESSNLSNVTACLHQVKSEKQKFDKSPLVVTAKFVRFDVYEVNSDSLNQKNLIQTAVFLTTKVHKGHFSNVETNGTVNILLYKGLDKMSRRQLCLTEKLLYINQSYYLFLNDTQLPNNNYSIINSTKYWNATYIPERLPNKKLQKIIFENKFSVNLDDMAAPFYEVIVETDSTANQAPKRGEVFIGDPLFVRCAVKGNTSEDPSLHWIHDGAPILSDADDKLIETNAKQLTSTLKIARFEPYHRGQYECTVKDKNGIRKRAKIKIDVKAGNYTTLFNEQLCAPDMDSYCKHGGICLVHKKTEFISCKCPEQFYGEKCEYKFSRVVTSDPITENCDDAKTECHNTMIAIGCITALAVVSLFICLLFLMRHRAKKHRETEETKTVKHNNDFFYMPSQIINGESSFSVQNEERNTLLSTQFANCSNCGRTYNKNAAKQSSRLSLQVPESQMRKLNSHLPKSASNSPMDPNCVLCMVETKKYSLPGYLKVSDVDSKSDQRLPVYVSTLPKKFEQIRHLGQSDEDTASLHLPKRSLSSPVTPEGSSRRIHEFSHQNVLQITELENSPNKINQQRTFMPKTHDTIASSLPQTSKSSFNRNEVTV